MIDKSCTVRYVSEHIFWLNEKEKRGSMDPFQGSFISALNELHISKLNINWTPAINTKIVYCRYKLDSYQKHNTLFNLPV